MPIVVLVIIIAAVWFASHGVYRAVVGTKCAFKGIDPPWKAARQEQLTNREIRRKQRKEVYGSPRTARGFVARLWGDAWEFANKFVDNLHNPETTDADLGELDTPDAPSAKPVVNVPADAGASWVRDLGGKLATGWARAQTLWDQWWLPSRRRCPWTYLNDETCGKAVKGKQATYCPSHQETHKLGHCLKITAGVECERPREGHYPFCSEHLDEVEAGKQPAPAAEPEKAQAPQVGTLDTPEAPTLEGAVPAGSAPTSASQPSGRTCIWGRHQHEGRPDYGHPACTAPTGEKDYFHCDPHATAIDVWADAEMQRRREADNQPQTAQPDEPLCQWGRGTTSESPDHGATPCVQQAGAGGIHCSPHQIEYGRWEAGTAEPQLAEPAVTAGAEADTSEPAPETDTPVQPETAIEPEPEVPPQRPVLRVVPNTNTQGDTNTMTAPAEITNVQSLKTFAEKVKSHGSQEWPSMLENAESQIGAAGLSNDPAITSEIGAMREAAAMFAAAGERLQTALAPHEGAAEQISGLGNRAADKTATYQNQ